MNWTGRSLREVGRASGETEAELLEAARSGAEWAYERLFRLHKDRVFSVCLRLIGDFHEAEDLTQESFVQAFRAMNDFRGDARFGTWLYRIAVRVAIDTLRRRNPQFDTLDEEHQASEVKPSGTSGGARDLTLERLQLERAMAHLPSGYRTVLILHDIEGYSHEEIAEILGFSPGTCKSQLHKSRRRLREILTGRQAS